jgi:hypothetical protein
MKRSAFLKGAGLALFGIGVGGVPTFIAKAANSFKEQNYIRKVKFWCAFFNVEPWMA